MSSRPRIAWHTRSSVCVNTLKNLNQTLQRVVVTIEDFVLHTEMTSLESNMWWPPTRCNITTWRLSNCSWRTSTHRWCNTSTSLLVRLPPDVYFGTSQLFGWDKSDLITETRSGLIVSDRHSLPLVSVNIPDLVELPFSTCGERKFQIDPLFETSWVLWFYVFYLKLIIWVSMWLCMCNG